MGKRKPPKFEAIYNIDFKRCMEVTYDEDTSGCDCVAVCRCSKIINVGISSISINNMVEAVCGYDLGRVMTNIDRYCLGRILVCNRFYDCDTDRWNLDIERSYYGEVVGGVYASVGKSNDDIKKYLSLKEDNERIFFVLDLEYGYVLDDVKNKTFTIENIATKDIMALSKGHYRKVDKEVVEYYRGESICGLVIKEADGYRLIDGYHRFIANKDKEILRMIVAS